MLFKLLVLYLSFVYKVTIVTLIFFAVFGKVLVSSSINSSNVSVSVTKTPNEILIKGVNNATATASVKANIITGRRSGTNNNNSTNSTTIIDLSYQNYIYLVHPGSLIHIFPRYGYLSLSMRIVSRNDSIANWLFLEPSKFIFDPTTVKIHEQIFIKSSATLANANLTTSTSDNKKDTKPPNSSSSSSSWSSSAVLQNQFHIDFCDTIEDLLAAYFTKFKVEGTEEPNKNWKAFAGGWQIASISKYFGINVLTKNNSQNFSYIFVRIFLIHSFGHFEPMSNITILNPFKKEFDDFNINSEQSSAYKFFNTIGTHYISSYLTGNSLYQVFLYNKSNSIMDKNGTSSGGGGFNIIQQYLKDNANNLIKLQQELPTLITNKANYIGNVMILNANANNTQNIQNLFLQQQASNKSVKNNTSNIFTLQNNKILVEKIEKYLELENDGLIGLELKLLDWLFKDEMKKKWYKEILHNRLNLWEENL